MSALSFGQTYGWIGAQTLVLMLPGLLVGGLMGLALPRLGFLLGFAFLVAVPLIVLCDTTTFTWVAERFLSDTTLRIFTTLLPSLMLYVTWPMIIEALVTIALFVVTLVLVWRAAGSVGRRWQSRERSVKPAQLTAVLVGIAALVSWPAISQYQLVIKAMAESSTRHPFCAFHIVGFRGVGVATPTGKHETIDRLRGLQSITTVHDRDLQQTALQVSAPAQATAPETRKSQKVIVIVIECLRPEIIDSAVMPNLAAFADKSIVCRRNFSGGNATCFGMFALVTGLEAVWFHRPVKDEPLLNRLLHEADYQLAFYGGGGSQSDWGHFNMEGFIAPQHYDDFRLEATDLPDSDRRTVTRTIDFIDQQRPTTQNDEPVAGRLAFAYMFATHRRFSEQQDQIFQPAATGDSMLRSPEVKKQFYNRYKNSARTVDRMIKPLLRDDCVVMIVGDHGEPFMDDGTAGHGTRLSRYQNMTPAVIYYPGVEPRTIDFPTFHADLLPTLLSVLDVSATDPTVFDGIDLLTSSDQRLAERSFVTLNYMDETSMLVGPWTFDPKQPFGYRVVFGIHDWQSGYLNPIDEVGLEWNQAVDVVGKQRFGQWITERFGAGAIDESKSRRELFTAFFHSPDRETRFSALKIAADATEVEDYLYRLIAEATRDQDPEIRDFAKELVIRINRIRGRSPDS